MSSPIAFNASKMLEDIRKKEALIEELEDKLHTATFELQELQRVNAANITIQWKESIKKCLEIEVDEKPFFLKTPAFISGCVAWSYGVPLTRDIKNKVATTLSVMFNQKLIGRIQYSSKTYYGNAHYFKNDLETLKKDYVEWINELKP